VTNDQQKDIQICNKHPTTQENILVHWTATNGKEQKTMKSKYLPIEAETMVPTTTSRGNGVWKNIQRQISSTQEIVEQGDVEAAFRLMLLYSYNNNDDGGSPSLPSSNQQQLGVNREEEKQ
jgi:hypothetical protein